jgi:hypothetical protein
MSEETEPGLLDAADIADAHMIPPDGWAVDVVDVDDPDAPDLDAGGDDD